MAQLLHGSATTTARTRAEFQNSKGHQSSVLLRVGDAVVGSAFVTPSMPRAGAPYRGAPVFFMRC